MPPSSDLQSFREALASSRNILILSGAGLSAASGMVVFSSVRTTRFNITTGIPTYRSADESLWNNFVSFRQIAASELFANQFCRIQMPTPLHKLSPRTRAVCGGGIIIDAGSKPGESITPNLFNLFYCRYLKAKPNNGHRALATLALPSALSRIAPCSTSRPLHMTQNIDSLSLRLLESLPLQSSTAAEGLVEMHGSIFVTKCTSCQKVTRSYAPSLASALEGDEDSNAKRDVPISQLPKCGGDSWAGSNRYGNCGGLLRPEVVWFGEIPPLMGEIARKMSQCDLLLVVGTSSTVSCRTL